MTPTKVQTRSGVALGLATLLLLDAGCSIGGQHKTTTPEFQTAVLCDLLERIAAGETITATVAGIYWSGYEHDVLYDSQTPLCDLDVQPHTEVQFDEEARIDPALKEYLNDNGRAYVTVKGVLWGPRPVGEDDLSLPPLVAYSRRIAGRRYGHLGASRTRFVVEEVVSWRAVPPAIPSIGEWSHSRPTSLIPEVVSAALPTYPEMALFAGISGTVVAKVTVEQGRVVDTTVLSGDRMLALAAEENIKTWRFRDGVGTTFSTTFTYRLEMRRPAADRNPRIELRLPSSVEITAAASGW